MSSHLIVYYGNSPSYLAIVWEIARITKRDGATPIAFGLTGVLGPVGDEFNRRALTALGSRSPDAQFEPLLRSEGIETLDAADYLARANGDIAFSPDARERMAETTRSAVISYSRDPLPNTSRGLWRKLERALEEASQAVFTSVSTVLRERPEITRVYVLNGRFPHQRAVIEAADNAGKEVFHYEKGEKPDTFWLSEHSTLDRVATQSSVDDVLSNFTPAEALDRGRAWMNRRSSRGSASNIYSRFFAGDAEAAAAPSDRPRKHVGIFTSSQDEFAALGPEWHLEDWADQWQAYDHVLNQLDGNDYEFYLRVHPNFATKSHRSFKRERRKLNELRSRHPQLRIIWHDEQVNSYALLAATDIVIVWDSTIGLEASGRGIPVWELAASYYDLYADVRPWFGPSDDPRIEDLDYEVGAARAHRFMAYLDVREPNLSPEAIAVQRALQPAQSLALTLTNVVSSGGAPTAAIGLLSVLDALRHRRFEINRIAVRRFLSKVSPMRDGAHRSAP